MRDATETHRGTVSRGCIVATVVVLLVEMAVGCDHPMSECTEDGECASGEVCLPVSSQPPEPTLRLAGPELEAPLSSADVAPRETTTVTATREELRVDGSVVSALEGLEGGNGGPEQLSIEPLAEKLRSALEQRREAAKRSGRSFVPEITIVVDKTAPSRLFARIVFTAGDVGFERFMFGARRAPGSGVWPAGRNGSEE